MSKDDFGGAVYRIYDHDDALIYIGSSGNPVSRIKQHRTRTVPGLPTSEQIRARYHRHEFTFYPTILEARAAEAVAIRQESPELNRRHVGTWRGMAEGAEDFVGVGRVFAQMAGEREMGLVEVACALEMPMTTYLKRSRQGGFTVMDARNAGHLFGVDVEEIAELAGMRVRVAA